MFERTENYILGTTRAQPASIFCGVASIQRKYVCMLLEFHFLDNVSVGNKPKKSLSEKHSVPKSNPVSMTTTLAH